MTAWCSAIGHSVALAAVLRLDASLLDLEGLSGSRSSIDRTDLRRTTVGGYIPFTLHTAEASSAKRLKQDLLLRNGMDRLQVLAGHLGGAVTGREGMLSSMTL